MTQDELKELLSYDHLTGLFKRLKQTSRRIKVGQDAGWKDAHGYLNICLHGRKWKAHRLAWLYMTGSFPAGEIDHINRVKDDNRFCNLRDVDRVANELNKGIQSNNTSGFKGVSYQKQSGKWEAYICRNKRKKSLGVFATPELAFKARAAHGIKGEA
jgi:hypothetical protein